MDNILAIPDSINVGRGRALRQSLILADHAWKQSKQDSMVIVEVGTLRDATPRAQFGDGWSSILWAWYAKENPKARVYLIDIDKFALQICQELISKHLGGLPINVTLHRDDAESWLKTIDLESKIDLLYLDGSDDPDEMDRQFRVVEDRNMMAKTSILNLDDIPADYSVRGKGTKLVPRLLASKNWKMLLDDRHAKQMMFGSGDYATS